MPTMEVLREVRVSGVNKFPGDRFETTDKEAKLWLATKRVRMATDPAPADRAPPTPPAPPAPPVPERPDPTAAAQTATLESMAGAAMDEKAQAAPEPATEAETARAAATQPPARRRRGGISQAAMSTETEAASEDAPSEDERWTGDAADAPAETKDGRYTRRDMRSQP